MIVAFDVDGVLIDDADKPIWKNVELVRWFMENDDSMVIVWSQSGREYASLWAKRLFLGPDVICRDKPAPDIKVDLCFDDEEVKFGRINIKVRRP